MTALASHISSIDSILSLRVRGRVSGISGLVIQACDLPLPLASLCRIESFGNRGCLAEVVGFADDVTLLMPLGSIAGGNRGDPIENVCGSPSINCCPQMLGRVLDGFGQPIDGLGTLPGGMPRRIDSRGAAPLDRRNIRGGRAHQLRRNGLVAPADQHDGVHRLGAHHLLDVHRHQVAKFQAGRV